MLLCGALSYLTANYQQLSTLNTSVLAVLVVATIGRLPLDPNASLAQLCWQSSARLRRMNNRGKKNVPSRFLVSLFSPISVATRLKMRIALLSLGTRPVAAGVWPR